MSNSFEVQKIVNPELEPGERLLWSGMPQQGLLLRKGDALMIPFSLMWGGFAIFWEYSAVTSARDPFFMLWGIPFVLVGLYLIFGRFFFDAWSRGRTWYGLTEERALIVSGAFSRRVQAITLKNLPEVSMDEGANGRGSIVFGAAAPGQSIWGGSGWPAGNTRMAPSFDLIEGVRHVYDMVRASRRG